MSGVAFGDEDLVEHGFASSGFDRPPPGEYRVRLGSVGDPDDAVGVVVEQWDECRPSPCVVERMVVEFAERSVHRNEVLEIVWKAPGLIGADVVELNPARDVGGITAALAAKLVKELVGRLLASNGTSDAPS